MKEYALYKGENILIIGTIKEIAAAMKVKEKTIHFYGSPTYQKRNKGKNAKALVKLEE